jgi:hypothetical protein
VARAGGRAHASNASPDSEQTSGMVQSSLRDRII